MLGVAYALRLEILAAEMHARTVAAGVAAALGAEVQVPRWDEVVAAFDADLAELPEDERPKDMTGRGIRLRALGIE